MVAILPRQDASVFYVNVGAIRDSGLLSDVSGPRVTEEQEYKDFVAQTNFDYQQDLDRLAGATTGDGDLPLARRPVRLEKAHSIRAEPWRSVPARRLLVAGQPGESLDFLHAGAVEPHGPCHQRQPARGLFHR